MQHSFDLHCHTDASDGTMRPSELIDLAVKSGIELLAITDHDTVNGIPEAHLHSNNKNIHLIHGVEISAAFTPGTMHICGYFIDIENKKLKKGLAFVQNSRKNRNPKIIEKLNQTGISISLEEVQKEAGKDQIGRPHFARALINKGYASNFEEAFNNYLGKGAPAYVNRPRLTFEESIELIHGAGGIAVIAHPSLLNYASNEEYKEQLKIFKNKGLDGIEAFSSHHSTNECEFFYQIGKELNMILTGGSDFHGENNPGVQLGSFYLPKEAKMEIPESFLEYYHQTVLNTNYKS